MNFEEIVNKFVEKPCRITTGAPSLSKRWGVDLDLVYQARAVAKDILKNKEEFGTEYTPEDVAFNGFTNISLNNIKDGDFLVDTGNHNEMGNGKLKSKWGSEGNWKYSYQYDNKEEPRIDFEGILNKVFKGSDFDVEVLPKVEITTDFKLNIYLADQHIGAEVDHGLYHNYFDKKVYRDRMNKVFIEIAKLNMLYKFKQINIFFLGDTFDGQDGFTVKRTHELPQNMSNDECFEVGLYTNKVFLERLFKSGMSSSYGVFFVRESNHGGDMDLYLFKALKLWIETAYPQVQVEIAKRFIDHVTLGNHTIIYTHGKDNRDMKNGLPLDLNDKTENYINDYIRYYGIKGNVLAIKADLHQDALSNGKQFSYRNVPSLFGSSKWIMSNYGNTEPGVAYDILTDAKRPIMGVIEF